MPSATQKRRRRGDFSPAVDWFEHRHKKLGQVLEIEVKDKRDWYEWRRTHDHNDKIYVTDVARLAQYYIEVKGYTLDQIMGDAIGEAAPNMGVDARLLGLVVEALSTYWVYCDEFMCWLSVCMKMPRPVISSY